MTDEVQNLTKNDTFTYEGYQIVRGEFLSQSNMPAICFDGVRLSVNAACLRKMPDVEYVQILFYGVIPRTANEFPERLFADYLLSNWQS